VPIEKIFQEYINATQKDLQLGSKNRETNLRFFIMGTGTVLVFEDIYSKK